MSKLKLPSTLFHKESQWIKEKLSGLSPVEYRKQDTQLSA